MNAVALLQDMHTTLVDLEQPVDDISHIMTRLMGNIVLYEVNILVAKPRPSIRADEIDGRQWMRASGYDVNDFRNIRQLSPRFGFPMTEKLLQYLGPTSASKILLGDLLNHDLLNHDKVFKVFHIEAGGASSSWNIKYKQLNPAARLAAHLIMMHQRP